MAIDLTLGNNNFFFQPEPDWAQLPEGWTFKECADVAVDSQDRVYIFNRGEHPVMVFEYYFLQYVVCN